MKMINDEVKITLGNKTITKKNRILNNFLDLMIWRVFPNENIYSKFENLLVDNNSEGMPFCYLKFDNTQTITDNSTIMDYDVFVGNQFFITSGLTTDIVTEQNKVTLYSRYEFESTILSSYVGSTLKGIGFGVQPEDINGGDTFITDYLMAFVDVSDLNLNIIENQKLIIERKDIVSTTSNFRGIDLQYPLHLNFLDIPGTTGENYKTRYITKIGTCINKNGSGNVDYDNSLTFTDNGDGNITISGFQNFNYADNNSIYPSDILYPSDNLYPVAEKQIQSMVFKYSVDKYDNGYQYYGSYYLYVPIEELDITYNNTSLEIIYKVERGE